MMKHPPHPGLTVRHGGYGVTAQKIEKMLDRVVGVADCEDGVCARQTTRASRSRREA